MKQNIWNTKAKSNWDVAVLFFLVLIVYLQNLSPSVYGGDSGDFLTASITNGVPHPSGYPLYTMLGILFLKLPLSATPAWKMGLISAIISSLAVVLIFKLVYELVESRVLALISSLTLAFLYPFWLYTEVVEVFALHNFFVTLLLFLVIKYVKSKSGGKKYVYALAFVAGLSLTNNQAILLLFPAIAVVLGFHWISPLINADRAALERIFFWKAKQTRRRGLTLKAWKERLGFMFKGTTFFLLGLTPYLYIPIAASRNPAVNWGNAVNLKNFLYLILRLDYMRGGGSEKAAYLQTLPVAYKMYLGYWQNYLGIIAFLVIVVVVLGIFYLIYKKEFKMLTLFIVSYLFLGPVFVIMAGASPTLSYIGVLERFYTASAIVLIIFLPFGALFIHEMASRFFRNKLAKEVFFMVTILLYATIPVSFFLNNYKGTDLHDVWIGDNLGRDVIGTLPENSLLVIHSDSAGFAALYMQHAYRFRDDIYIPGRGMGYDEILRILYGMSDEEISKFSIESRNVILTDITTPKLALLVKERNVFSDNVINIKDAKFGKIVSVPWGLLNKLEFEAEQERSKEEYLAQMKKITDSFQFEDLIQHKATIDQNARFSEIRSEYIRRYENIARYLEKHYGDEEAARVYLEKAKNLSPNI